MKFLYNLTLGICHLNYSWVTYGRIKQRLSVSLWFETEKVKVISMNVNFECFSLKKNITLEKNKFAELVFNNFVCG